MASIPETFRSAIARFFAKKSDPAGASPRLQVFDTITMESILSPRGQNPFPEEDGEIGFMSSTIHERSLHSR